MSDKSLSELMTKISTKDNNEGTRILKHQPLNIIKDNTESSIDDFKELMMITPVDSQVSNIDEESIFEGERLLKVAYEISRSFDRLSSGYKAITDCIINHFKNQFDDKPEIVEESIEVEFDNDINKEDNKEERSELLHNNDLCDKCMVKDIVGCNHCGIYQYAIIRNDYEIMIRRNDNNGVNTK